MRFSLIDSSILIARCIFGAIAAYTNWNRNAVILMKFSPLAATEGVQMTTFGSASDEKFIKFTLSFQWPTAVSSTTSVTKLS